MFLRTLNDLASWYILDPRAACLTKVDIIYWNSFKRRSQDISGHKSLRQHKRPAVLIQRVYVDRNDLIGPSTPRVGIEEGSQWSSSCWLASTFHFFTETPLLYSLTAIVMLWERAILRPACFSENNATKSIVVAQLQWRSIGIRVLAFRSSVQEALKQPWRNDEHAITSFVWASSESCP